MSEILAERSSALKRDSGIGWREGRSKHRRGLIIVLDEPQFGAPKLTAPRIHFWSEWSAKFITEAEKSISAGPLRHSAGYVVAQSFAIGSIRVLLSSPVFAPRWLTDLEFFCGWIPLAFPYNLR